MQLNDMNKFESNDEMIFFTGIVAKSRKSNFTKS